MQNSTSYMSAEDTNRFKSYMVGAGYNMTSLARAVGMSREMLSFRINGKVDFGRKEMNKISEQLNKPASEIFFGG